MNSRSPISRFDRPSAISRKISSSRAVSSSSAGGGAGARHAGELLDHPPGDRRREQRVAGRDRADGGDQLLGRVVLEHEAARARVQRLVDVLVEVEGREDQDRAPPGRRRGSAASPRGRPAPACGCPSGPRSGEARGLVDRLHARCRPRRRPRCPARRASSIRKPARTSDWSSATSTRMLIAGRLAEPR